jgi:hypothetical protein
VAPDARGGTGASALQEARMRHVYTPQGGQGGARHDPDESGFATVEVTGADLDAWIVRMELCAGFAFAKVAEIEPNRRSNETWKLEIRGVSRLVKAEVGTVLMEGDVLYALGSGGRLTWHDGTIIRIEQGSIVRIGDPLKTIRPGTPPELINPSVLRGLLEFWLPKSEPAKRYKFEPSTGTVVVAVKGTVFALRHDDQTQVSAVMVEEGVVEVTPTNPALAPFTLQAGQQVEVTSTSVGAVLLLAQGSIALGEGPAATEPSRLATLREIERAVMIDGTGILIRKPAGLSLISTLQLEDYATMQVETGAIRFEERAALIERFVRESREAFQQLIQPEIDELAAAAP